MVVPEAPVVVVPSSCLLFLMMILLLGTASGSHTGHSSPVNSQYPGSPAGVVMEGRGVGVSFGFGVVMPGDCFKELVEVIVVNSVSWFTVVVSLAKLGLMLVDCFNDKAAEVLGVMNKVVIETVMD